ncbi:MAG: efflux transporter outer membrane subunit, partial [Burkholderiales bacterium]|nr:efflux transporter outer membrane subunit [Burkholderiales bacterium]
MRPQLHAPIASAVAAIAAALLAAGCANYDGLATKAVPADAAALAASATLSAATVSAAWPAANWWQRFGDPQLDALIAEALAGNPGMGSARARVDRALALAASAGAARFPQASAGASVTRQRYSSNGIFPPPIAGSWHTQTDLAASFGYEFDLWGRNRAAYEAALGQTRAAEVDAYAVRLLLAANVARAYVQLGRSFEQLQLARDTLAQRQSMFELTQQRVAAGLDSEVELKQAEGSIPAARQRIAQLGEEVALGRNLLAALAGQGPDRGLAITRPHLQQQAIALPAVLPADLLGRRPDVVAQRWRVESARRDIDAAKGQFYPNVNLSALVGVQSISFAKLLSVRSENPAFGPALRLPLFDGGRLRGNLAAKDAEYDLAVGQYNQTLVDAMHEVVDQLASLKSVDAQRAELEHALASARSAHALASARYRAGLASYLQVLAT